MTTFEIKRGDTLPALRAILTGGDGVAANLTGATVLFKMRDGDGTLVTSASVTVVDADDGLVQYNWVAADTDTAGLFLGEFEVTWSPTAIETFPNDGFVTINIAPDVATTHSETYSTDVCSLWTTIEAVRTLHCSTEDGITDSVLGEAIAVASDILFHLSGRQFSGQCSTTVRPCAKPHSAPEHSWLGYSSYFSEWGSCSCWETDDCGCQSVRRVYLGPHPVVSIASVYLDGTLLAASDYQVIDYRWLMLTNADLALPCCQRLDLPATQPDTFEVTFSYGVDPPMMGKQAAGVLACEVAKSLSNSDTCRLPSNIRSITRQGVTFDLSGLEDIREGLTGLGDIVDLFLQATNPNRILVNSAVWTPTLHNSTRRITWP